MIVTSGKSVIKNYFGGQYSAIADTIAVGTGTTAVTLADTALATEVLRVAVTAINADLTNNRIVFKATLPAGFTTTISEVGIFYLGLAPNSALLVARTVLGTPATVDPIIPTEVEYSLGISV